MAVAMGRPPGQVGLEEEDGSQGCAAQQPERPAIESRLGRGRSGGVGPKAARASGPRSRRRPRRTRSTGERERSRGRGGARRSRGGGRGGDREKRGVGKAMPRTALQVCASPERGRRLQHQDDRRHQHGRGGDLAAALTIGGILSKASAEDPASEYKSAAQARPHRSEQVPPARARPPVDHDGHAHDTEDHAGEAVQVSLSLRARKSARTTVNSGVVVFTDCSKAAGDLRLPQKIRLKGIRL